MLRKAGYGISLGVRQNRSQTGADNAYLKLDGSI